MKYDVNEIYIKNQIYQIEKMLESRQTRSCITEEDCSDGLKDYLNFLKKQLKEYEK